MPEFQKGVEERGNRDPSRNWKVGLADKSVISKCSK